MEKAPIDDVLEKQRALQLQKQKDIEEKKKALRERGLAPSHLESIQEDFWVLNCAIVRLLSKLVLSGLCTDIAQVTEGSAVSKHELPVVWVGAIGFLIRGAVSLVNTLHCRRCLVGFYNNLIMAAIGIFSWLFHRTVVNQLYTRIKAFNIIQISK